MRWMIGLVLGIAACGEAAVATSPRPTANVHEGGADGLIADAGPAGERSAAGLGGAPATAATGGTDSVETGGTADDSALGAGAGGEETAVPMGSAGAAGAAGASACEPKTKEELCGSRQCGATTGDCGESFDCGSCANTQNCTGGKCKLKAACKCTGACGVYSDGACPEPVDCGSCDASDVCTESLGQGRVCFAIGFAGSCDPTTFPNPNGPCGAMCEGAKPGCEKPYKDCGPMFATDGSQCPACSGVAIGRWQCGAG